mgnify:CR=1 FL=1
MDEVAIARRWLANPEASMMHIVQVTDPDTKVTTWMNTTLNRPALPVEIAAAEVRPRVLQAITEVVLQDSSFRTTQALNLLALAQRAEEDRLSEEFNTRERDAEATTDAAIASEKERVEIAKAKALDKSEKDQIVLKSSAALQEINVRAIHARQLAKEEHERALATIAERGVEDRYTAELKNRFDVGLVEREGQIQAELENTKMKFQSEQNALDRALRALDLQEANRAAVATEALRGQELSLSQQQFKLSVFQTLAASPEILYFLGKQGGAAMAQFGDLFGDGGALMDEMMTRINSQPAANIQEFATLSAGEQGIERFRLSAQTGIKDTTAALRGSAPRAVINRTAFDAPIQPGSPTPRDRIRLGRSHATPR